MNVASLELCKELYELSDWFKTHYIWRLYEDDQEPEWVQTFTNIRPVSYTHTDHTYVPAYDLGYLLRRLPSRVPNSDFNFWYRLSLNPFADVGWTATYENHAWATSHKAAFSRKGYDSDSIAALVTFYGDTPEDATAKLAIELFEQGILTKDTIDN